MVGYSRYIRIESTDGNFGTHEKVAIPIPIVTCILFPYPFPFSHICENSRAHL